MENISGIPVCKSFILTNTENAEYMVALHA